MPSQLFWSVTVYDAERAARSKPIRTWPRSARCSSSRTSPTNHSSISISGRRRRRDVKDNGSRRLPARAGSAYFRVYGPKDAAFDGSWKPGDFTAGGIIEESAFRDHETTTPPTIHRQDVRARGPVTEQRVVEELIERTLHRRAVEAAIWGMPIVSFDAMRQAFLRDAGAKYNDIVFWSSPADWRLQITTPNAVIELRLHCDQHEEWSARDRRSGGRRCGPVWVDQRRMAAPLADIGHEGIDAGRVADISSCRRDIRTKCRKSSFPCT